MVKLCMIFVQNVQAIAKMIYVIKLPAPVPAKTDFMVPIVKRVGICRVETLYCTFRFIGKAQFQKM